MTFLPDSQSIILIKHHFGQQPVNQADNQKNHQDIQPGHGRTHPELQAGIFPLYLSLIHISTKIDKDTLIRLYVETKLPADFDASSDVAEIFTNKYGASLRDEGSLEVLLDIQTNSCLLYTSYDNERPDYCETNDPHVRGAAAGACSAAFLLCGS